MLKEVFYTISFIAFPLIFAFSIDFLIDLSRNFPFLDKIIK